MRSTLVCGAWPGRPLPRPPSAMTLASLFIEFADQQYAIDWAAIQRSVAARLRLRSSFDTTVYDPWRYPSYWCVPLLVGSYVGASRRAVLDDTEAFLSGCVMRHLMFETVRPFDPAQDADSFRAIANAYDGCQVGAAPGWSFDARFAAKCLPWTVLLAIGTRSIMADVGRRDHYDAAMRAIVLVHSCLQMIDDWHDREEDVARSHWNMWVDAPIRDSLRVVEPLVRGSHASVQRLRPHLLRTALTIQLRDTAVELADVVLGVRGTVS